MRMVFTSLVPRLLKKSILLSREKKPPYFYGYKVCIAFATGQLEEAIFHADRIIQDKPMTLVLWEINSGKIVHIIESGIRDIHKAHPNERLRKIADYYSNG